MAPKTTGIDDILNHSWEQDTPEDTQGGLTAQPAPVLGPNKYVAPKVPLQADRFYAPNDGKTAQGEGVTMPLLKKAVGSSADGLNSTASSVGLAAPRAVREVMARAGRAVGNTALGNSLLNTADDMRMAYRGAVTKGVNAVDALAAKAGNTAVGRAAQGLSRFVTPRLSGAASTGAAGRALGFATKAVPVVGTAAMLADAGSQIYDMVRQGYSLGGMPTNSLGLGDPGLGYATSDVGKEQESIAGAGRSGAAIRKAAQRSTNELRAQSEASDAGTETPYVAPSEQGPLPTSVPAPAGAAPVAPTAPEQAIPTSAEAAGMPEGTPNDAAAIESGNFSGMSTEDLGKYVSDKNNPAFAVNLAGAEFVRRHAQETEKARLAAGDSKNAGGLKGEGAAPAPATEQEAVEQARAAFRAANSGQNGKANLSLYNEGNRARTGNLNFMAPNQRAAAQAKADLYDKLYGAQGELSAGEAARAAFQRGGDRANQLAIANAGVKKEDQTRAEKLADQQTLQKSGHELSAKQAEDQQKAAQAHQKEMAGIVYDEKIKKQIMDYDFAQANQKYKANLDIMKLGLRSKNAKDQAAAQNAYRSNATLLALTQKQLQYAQTNGSDKDIAALAQQEKAYREALENLANLQPRTQQTGKPAPGKGGL